MSITGAERGAVYHGHATAHAAPGALSTILGWITTVDHKRIGILYGVTAFAFFLLGGIEALIIRLQLARPHGTVVSAETFNALFWCFAPDQHRREHPRDGRKASREQQT